jgi:hypothetical protein
MYNSVGFTMKKTDGFNERVSSGIEGMDKVLDYIRLGDNVVYQVENIEEYQFIALRFASQCIKDKRRTVYIRFAPHEAILAEQDGLTVYTLDPSNGFENFTTELHRIIAEEGTGVMYVFDCLSQLQSVWAADLMMGNFFAVTCPFLYELDTVAWFCILRNTHNYATIARIRDTTQLLIDLYPDTDCIFIHPVKIWKRYSPVMFFPHRLNYKDLSVSALTDGISVSRFYELAGKKNSDDQSRNFDSFERFFLDIRKSADKDIDAMRRITERLVGSSQQLFSLISSQFTVKGLLEIKDRLIGSGKIGGKAIGMLLARRIIQNSMPDKAHLLEPHDSFFIGSDVFYTYLVHNNLWKLRVLQKTHTGYFEKAEELKEGILKGFFPETIREQFVRTLEYFGQSPIIVRSSSLLEDSFGNAFAGKYESVFCVNTGSPEERLKNFEKAVLTVYASTMDESALMYRRDRGLEDDDEQMAILVQRVSGSLRHPYFFPDTAGVGYSFNMWKWHKNITMKDGMIRLVAGLGTSAVDRRSSGYPRLIALKAAHIPSSRGDDKSLYSQKLIDVLNLEKNEFETLNIDAMLPYFPQYLTDLVMERNYETERRLAEAGIEREVNDATCEGAAGNKAFTDFCHSVLKTLEAVYDCPVDIEFTANWNEKKEFVMNLLQCRPLQTIRDETSTLTTSRKEAENNAEKVFFNLTENVMGPQMDISLDLIVVIDSKTYYEMNWKDKPTTARYIHTINTYCKEHKKKAMFIAPGRLGTSSCELGVPVTFADINGFTILCEKEETQYGYQPELSFGSHFFQDLVENNCYYAALKEDSCTDSFLSALKIRTDIICLPEADKELVKIVETSSVRFTSYTEEGSCICYSNSADFPAKKGT